MTDNLETKVKTMMTKEEYETFHATEAGAKRMKNHRPHCVPLSYAAIAILTARPRKREHVFGLNGAGYSGWSQAKLRIDAAAQI
jgi:hypothetical protein